MSTCRNTAPVLNREDPVFQRRKHSGAIRLPDKLGTIDGVKVRYILCLDVSYLEQSTARVDVWNQEAMCWNALWEIPNLLSDGWSLGETVHDPLPLLKDNKVLAVGSAPEAEKAYSWSKLYVELHRMAEEVLS